MCARHGPRVLSPPASMRLARCALRAPEPQPRVWASPHSYLAGGDRPDQQALPPRGRRPHLAEDGVGARHRLRCELCRASVHPVPPPTLVRRVHVLRATLNNGAHTVACAGAAGLAVVKAVFSPLIFWLYLFGTTVGGLYSVPPFQASLAPVPAPAPPPLPCAALPMPHAPVAAACGVRRAVWCTHSSGSH